MRESRYGERGERREMCLIHHLQQQGVRLNKGVLLWGRTCGNTAIFAIAWRHGWEGGTGNSCAIVVVFMA